MLLLHFWKRKDDYFFPQTLATTLIRLPRNSCAKNPQSDQRNHFRQKFKQIVTSAVTSCGRRPVA